ncbi:MAG TPA: SUMF1/EgtB/PvdO family nonheme iron enzyme, partial [Planctomycetota bacterium]|nr:SUMF1/EgtB/PvdO family nonheme iron enzyme [Planctomycetota bacterium]
VDWSMCDGLMRQHGLTLPTEAQWEYGCRAGSTTPWLCARDELQVYANLADESAKRARAPYTCEAWTDGHTVHAPVGSFLPSAFGLHDVQGNVCEWCLDEQGSYSLGVREGDGLRLKNEGSSIRIARGGFFSQPAISARSAHRTYDAQALRSEAQGLRPARTLRLPD